MTDPGQATLFVRRSSDRDSNATDELARILHEGLARIVELRFFGGQKHPAIAEILDVPLRSVERGWSTARAWLYQRISEE